MAAGLGRDEVRDAGLRRPGGGVGKEDGNGTARGHRLFRGLWRAFIGKGSPSGAGLWVGWRHGRC